MKTTAAVRALGERVILLPICSGSGHGLRSPRVVGALMTRKRRSRSQAWPSGAGCQMPAAVAALVTAFRTGRMDVAVSLLAPDVDRFAVRFTFDQTDRTTGRRADSVKMSSYTVESGLITREEVYYLEHP